MGCPAPHKRRWLPKVRYTGSESSYFVMVMDLLGPKLQDILESNRRRTLSPEAVCDIGKRRFCLLRKLHYNGFMHGDVKPENFVFSHSEDNAIDLRRRLSMIDLGLSTNWRDRGIPGAHTSYKQRPGNCNGTLPYASKNEHVVRLFSRRDDLYSLEYMLLYLLRP